MVLKKLGEELTEQFMQVVEYLGVSERMHVVVEPAVYKQHIAHRCAQGRRRGVAAGLPCLGAGCRELSSPGPWSTAWPHPVPCPVPGRPPWAQRRPLSRALSPHPPSSHTHTPPAPEPTWTTATATARTRSRGCTALWTLWCAWAATASSCTPRASLAAPSPRWSPSTWAQWASSRSTTSTTTGAQSPEPPPHAAPCTQLACSQGCSSTQPPSCCARLRQRRHAGAAQPVVGPGKPPSRRPPVPLASTLRSKTPPAHRAAAFLL
jgi:hypothetical protein